MPYSFVALPDVLLLQASTRTTPQAGVAASAKGKRAATSRKGKGPAKKTRPSLELPPAPAQFEDEVSESESGVDEESLDEPSTSSGARAVARPPGSMPLVPRTEAVDEHNLRQKIRQGKFVDFKLLVPSPEGRSLAKKFTLRDGHFQEVEDVSKLHFYDWLKAYVVYMSVFLEFFPKAAQGMLRHMQVVQDMHGAGKDAVGYDRQFRRLKAQNPDVAWGEYMTELANGLRDVPPRKPASATLRAGAKFRPFSKVCYRFNSPAGCELSTCSFPHKCRRCASMDHPMHRCSRPQRGRR